MATKVFLDTNIVADVMDSSRGGHKRALALLEYLIFHDYAICISEDMLTTLFYISKDKKAVLLFFENVIFIDWEILVFGLETIKLATNLSLEKDLDLEDTLQCLCAKENGCKMVITNDKNFYDCGMNVSSVELFLNRRP